MSRSFKYISILFVLMSFVGVTNCAKKEPAVDALAKVTGALGEIETLSKSGKQEDAVKEYNELFELWEHELEEAVEDHHEVYEELELALIGVGTAVKKDPTNLDSALAKCREAFKKHASHFSH